MSHILLIGATGRTGREVADQLASSGVRALVRNPDTAALPPRIEIVRGDLTLPETLDAALDGIDTVFLVWTAPPAAVTPAVQRIVKRARRIVYLSGPYKTAHPMFQQPNTGALVNVEIERLIEDSGCEWTFLRPGMFSSNARYWWVPQLRSGDHVRWPYLSVPTAPIDERDIAAVAVCALCEEGHTGAEYVITGGESLTHLDQISIIGDVLGRPLRIEEMSPQEAEVELLAYFPPFVARMLLNAWGAAAGHPAHMTSTFTEVTGRAPRTFRQWVTDHASEFSVLPQGVDRID